MGLNIYIFGFVFAEIFEFFEIDFTQYDTVQSQVLHSIILRGVTLTARSQQPFLNKFAQAFKGTVAQK